MSGRKREYRSRHGRIKPHAKPTKGRKIHPLEGGVFITRRNPDGTVTRYFKDEYGREVPLDTEATNAPHA